ncbi:SEC-C metal-binding domain-containing protein [Bacillus sp. 3255]|uniref:YecA family protein n=2 Tax=Bacillales TaxID=1385 RepID=UPI00286D3C1B|nr:SEC-C metal-binding domain-containing protein [Bacillus sp. 3255]
MKEMDKRQSAKHQNEAAVGGGFYPEMTVPLSLADRLVRLSKGELTEIRTNLEIKGVSSLKKQDLAIALERHIPDALPVLLHKMDETRYQILKQVAGRGGVSHTPIDFFQLHYFESRGLLFAGIHKGKFTLAMPQEVLHSFQKLDVNAYREKFKRNAEWIKLTSGMLFYYGRLNEDEMLNLVKQHMGSDVQVSEYLTVIKEAIPFYQQIVPDSKGYHNIELINPKQVQLEQESRLSISLYPFTKSQLLAAGEPGFVDRNQVHKAFIDFIRKNYSVGFEDADLIVEDCVDQIRNGAAAGVILQSLQQQLEIDDLELTRGFMSCIAALNNGTRMWALKGYSPSELSAAIKPAGVMQQAPAQADVIDMRTRTKIGRNDPCPCGSGKKFKKCCAS